MPIGTYTMLKGTKPAFEEKASANWGITTTQVPLAWIMNEPTCKLISKWAVGESFTIDHWA